MRPPGPGNGPCPWARMTPPRPPEIPAKMIPQLSTASSGPLADLEGRILDGSAAVEHRFRGRWQAHTPPFYASVDLHNSGFELAPAGS